MEDQRHFIRGVSPVSGARLWRLKTNQWKMKSAVWELEMAELRKTHRNHGPEVDEVDVAGQVPRHRLVRGHQAVALVVVGQVDHPVQQKLIEDNK